MALQLNRDTQIQSWNTVDTVVGTVLDNVADTVADDDD